jgi:hypothetical protein
MKEEIIDQEELQQNISKRIFNDMFQYSVCLKTTFEQLMENDFSNLSAQEIIEKIRDHLKQNPSNVSSLIFLKYLSCYPVSMCKREVSPRLKKLIGFHYNLGIPEEHLENEHGVSRVSYEDLAEIFVRSKATISEYVNQFKDEWVTFENELAQAENIEQQAKRQLIEEEKEKIRLEKQIENKGVNK